MSKPRPTTSVATRTRQWPSRNRASAASLACCFFPPWIVPQLKLGNCSDNRSMSSSAARRVSTNIMILPSWELWMASRKWARSTGNFSRMLSPVSAHLAVSNTSTICSMSLGGNIGDPPEYFPEAPMHRTMARSPPTELHNLPAADSTSCGHVAEKKSICLVAGISLQIVSRSLSKPSDNIRSPSSSTRQEMLASDNSPPCTRSSKRPGVATTRCVFPWDRKRWTWSLRLAPP
mmetsp:Transcript_4430/g.12765  ORF Transcript_4430/g.12765 Transcript_4430/m.12765 type:complete len:233 (+) Transcript_4430:370-1068(+)